MDPYRDKGDERDKKAKSRSREIPFIPFIPVGSSYKKKNAFRFTINERRSVNF